MFGCFCDANIWCTTLFHMWQKETISPKLSSHKVAKAYFAGVCIKTECFFSDRFITMCLKVPPNVNDTCKNGLLCTCCKHFMLWLVQRAGGKNMWSTRVKCVKSRRGGCCSIHTHALALVRTCVTSAGHKNCPGLHAALYFRHIFISFKSHHFRSANVNWQFRHIIISPNQNVNNEIYT